MTQRERFRRVMEFQPVDKVPNYELCCWGQTLERWEAEGMPRDLNMNFFEGEPYFGLERRGFVYLNIFLDPTFAYEVLEEDERYIVARYEDGSVTRALKEGTVRGTRPSMDQHLSHPVTDRASFEAMKQRYDPRLRTRYPQPWFDEWARMWKTRDYPLFLLGNGTFGLYSWLRRWCGTEAISYLFYDEPELVEEMLDFATDFLLELIEPALQQVECDAFNYFEDFAGKGGPLISPQIFEKFFLKRYQRINARLNGAGIKYIWLDSDGETWQIIPLLMDAGITCHWPLERASGMDPREVRKRFPGLALAGGIDKMEIAKDRKAIETELYSLLPPMLESGGYLPILDHAFPPDISYDNFRYYLEVKEKLLQTG
ncbi:MAG: uroporphyrinogen decarboxylase family protein [Armatimonadota bacterium]